LLELEQRFSGDEACAGYLASVRWPAGWVCPRCAGEAAWSVRRARWRCGQCRYEMSVTAGTIFQDSHLPLTTWFRAMWHVTSQKNGISALGLQRVLGLGSYKTAWAMLHKLRRAMVRPGRERLQGIVEVDETYWGNEEAGVKGRRTQDRALINCRRRGEWERHWSNPSAMHPGLNQGLPTRIHRPSHRTGQHRPNRGFERLPGVDRLHPRPSGAAPPNAGRTFAAASPSRDFAAEAMVDGHSSGCCRARPPRRLPRRIRIPLQPPHVSIPREVVLSTGSTGCPGESGPVCNFDQITTCWAWWRQVNIPIPD